MRIGRRALAASALVLAGAAGPGRRLQVAWSDDVTHVMSNLSVWRQNRETLSDRLLTAAFEEAFAAGADTLLVQPGLGWMP